MPRPRRTPLFELGGQWINTEPGRAGFWRYWYDAGARKVRRAVLGSRELEQAKVELAAIILKARTAPAETMPLQAVMDRYHEERTDHLPSKKPARAATRVVIAHFGADTLVSDLTDDTVAAFARAEVARKASLGYISRNLSVVAAGLTHAKLPPIPYSMAWLRKVAPASKVSRRIAIPTDANFKTLLSSDVSEPLFRWMLLSLATGARPEAVLDLAPVQRHDGLLELNPEGRAQNKKHRPVVREPAHLVPWLDAWGEDAVSLELYGRYVAYASVESVQTALERLSKATGIKVSAYSFRHKVTTVLRRAKRHGVTEDDIAMQLGHRRPHLRVTGGYGEFEPDYLEAPAKALSAWLEGLGYSRNAPAIERARDERTGYFLKKSVS